MIARFSANKNGKSFQWRCYRNDLNEAGNAKTCLGDDGEKSNVVNDEACFPPNFLSGVYCTRNDFISDMIEELKVDCPTTTTVESATTTTTTREGYFFHRNELCSIFVFVLLQIIC